VSGEEAIQTQVTTHSVLVCEARGGYSDPRVSREEAIQTHSLNSRPPLLFETIVDIVDVRVECRTLTLRLRCNKCWSGCGCIPLIRNCQLLSLADEKNKKMEEFIRVHAVSQL